MVNLYDIIHTLSREESRNLKIFLKRTNADAGRKDIALLDYAKKNYPNPDEDEIVSKLYGSNDKNAFYRLKNRLQSDINKSLLLLHYDNTEYNHVSNLLGLARIFHQKRAYKIAFKYLIKGERKAIQKEYFDLLDLIYSNLISLSHESLDFNPEQYVKRRKANQKNLFALQEIDNILAPLAYQIKTSQNFSVQEVDFTTSIQKTINKFASSEEVKKSSRLRLKIYDSVSRILLQKKDFKTMETYLKSTYKEFSNKGLFNKSNHATKLQMLSYLINALFKNRKIEASLDVTKELLEAMKEYQGFLYGKYLLYYYNSLVINYQVSDKDKALQVLEEMKEVDALKGEPGYVFVIFGNLTVLYFGLNRFKEARKNIVKLKRHENFEKLDRVFQLKINVAELIIIFELKDIDLFDYQLNIVYKDFPEVLKEKLYVREKLLIELLQQMDKMSKAELKRRVADFTKITNVSSEHEIISYNPYLESKL